MLKIKTFFSALVKKLWETTKTNYQENKKAILYAYLVFFVTLVILLLIDQLSKTFIFEFYQDTKKGRFEIDHSQFQDFDIIGTRSVANPGITFTGNKKINVPFIQALSLIAVLIFSTLVYYFPLINFTNFFIIIAFSGLSAGSLGNAIDRFAFGVVKDIFYVPYLENQGTFNFADGIVVGGGVLMVLNSIVSFFLSAKKNRQLNAQKTPLAQCAETKTLDLKEPLLESQKALVDQQKETLRVKLSDNHENDSESKKVQKAQATIKTKDQSAKQK